MRKFAAMRRVESVCPLRGFCGAKFGWKFGWKIGSPTRFSTRFSTRISTRICHKNPLLTKTRRGRNWMFVGISTAMDANSRKDIFGASRSGRSAGPPLSPRGTAEGTQRASSRSRFSQCVASARVPRSARPGRGSRRSSRASLGQSVADDISTGLARQATTRRDDAARVVLASVCPTATCLAMQSRCC